ncbi:hypothetical protein LQR31_13680, partial [Chromobacterium vaccinii]|uniref:hypothetical protein n=1 Tax=Chromobacterium vaccinii TaxID=1108595 RepID=UPI001E37BE0A
MGRNSHVVLEAHDVCRETGTEPRYRAIFDPAMPIAMPNMAKKRDLRYWLSLPRIGAWGGAGRDSERERAARRALPPTSNTGGKSAPQAEAQNL